MLKILQARFQQYVNQELPDVQAGFRKGRGTREQIANICWVIEKAREFQKKSICFTDYVNPLTVWITTKCGKFLKRWDHQIPYLPPDKPVCRSKRQNWTRKNELIQNGKGVHQGYICHPAYLTYMQSTSCEMPDWMKRKLESGLPGEISTTSDMQKTSP